MSLFTAVEMAPRDPILGLNEQFAADTNPNKVNLGVGVYFDDNGKLPLLECVQAAEKAMMDKPSARGYLPIDGIAAYDAAVKSLVFGADSEPVKSGRVATVQGIGGTGGLKIGADFLKKVSPNAKVLLGANTMAGLPIWAITLAMVKVLPEPVTPNKVWNTSPSFKPSTKPSMAVG